MLTASRGTHALLVSRYGGLRSERLQAAMLASGDEPGAADVERFCDQARQAFRARRYR